MKLIHLALVAALVGGCVTEKGFVDYKETGVFSSESAGNKKFDDVGPVSSDASGFAWDSCDRVATAAVRSMLDIAKARGGNTVYNVKFDSTSGATTSPTCKKAYGWFALWIVGGLGPWVTTSTVEGVAAKLEDGPKSASAIFIPEGADTAKLAAEFVAGATLSR